MEEARTDLEHQAELDRIERESNPFLPTQEPVSEDEAAREMPIPQKKPDDIIDEEHLAADTSTPR